MDYANALGQVADMFGGELYDTAVSDFAAAPWTYGALSLVSQRTITVPAIQAIQATDPQWREWDRDEAITHLRALAGEPATRGPHLAAARGELEATRQALGAALGVHPASQYTLSDMVNLVRQRLT